MYTTILDSLQNTPFITKQNLGLVLQKSGRNLDYWAEKLVRDNMLYVLKKGFYIPSVYYSAIKTSSPNSVQLYHYYLANSLRQPSYVSLESVLSQYNVLAESTFTVTSITLKSTRTYATGLGSFSYRHIKERMFHGYGITNFNDKNIRQASLAKALFDYLYLRTFTDEHDMQNFLLSYGRLNWSVLTKPDMQEFSKIVETSDSQKMRKILLVLQQGKIL